MSRGAGFVGVLSEKEMRGAERVLSAGTWAITLGAVVFSVLTVTPLMTAHTPAKWQWTAPILPVVVDAAVIITVRLDAVLARIGVDGGPWPLVLRWMVGLFTLLLNTGQSLLNHDKVGAAVHAVAPLLLIVTSETALVYRRAMGQAKARAEKAAADERAARRAAAEAERKERAEAERADREAQREAEAERVRLEDEREQRRLDAEQQRLQLDADRQARAEEQATERERLRLEAAAAEKRAEREAEAERIRLAEERARRDRLETERRAEAERERQRIADEHAKAQREQRERELEQRRLAAEQADRDRERQVRAEALAAAEREQRRAEAEQRRISKLLSAEPTGQRLDEEQALAVVRAAFGAGWSIRETQARCGWSVGWVSKQFQILRQEQELPAADERLALTAGGAR